jgi:NADPH-dependent 2,4-dienoyl-CoA reductase/sulfur reductase-like enzyme
VVPGHTRNARMPFTDAPCLVHIPRPGSGLQACPCGRLLAARSFPAPRAARPRAAPPPALRAPVPPRAAAVASAAGPRSLRETPNHLGTRFARAEAELSRGFDVVVVGSGMGGLAAAAALAAHARLRVAVLERQVTPGGYLQSFSRKGYTWETGVHAIGGRGARARVRRGRGAALRGAALRGDEARPLI